MKKYDIQQVYLCKMENKKKIYFNEISKDFGSVCHFEKKASTGLLLTTNILSYSFIRQFDFITLNSRYELLVIFVAVLLGGAIGVIASMVRRKKRTEKGIIVKKNKMNQKEFHELLRLIKIELNQNEDTVFLLLGGAVFSIVVFYFFKTLFLLFGGMVLMSLGVFCLLEYDLKKRKSIYSELKKMEFE